MTTAVVEQVLPERAAPVTDRGQIARLSYYAVAAAVIALIAVILRVAGSGYSPWFDEYASVIFAHRPLNLLWSGWMVRETNPPLYYSLLRGWMQLFGGSVAVMRLLSIVSGMLGLLLLGEYCRRWFGWRTAIVAMALGAVSAQHIYYSQQMRGYIFCYTAVLLSLIGITRLTLMEAQARSSATLYVSGACIAIYCHTTMFIWPAAATLAALIAAASMAHPLLPLVRRLLIANFILAVLAAWWFLITAWQITHPNGNIGWLQQLSFSSFRYTVFDTVMIVKGHWGGGYYTARLVALLSVVGTIVTWRRHPAVRIAAVAGGLSLVMFLGAGMVQPIIVDRTLFWFSLFPTILVAAAVGRVADLRLYIVASAVLVGLVVMNFAASRPYFEMHAWDPFLRRIARDPRAIVVVEGRAMEVVARTACEIARQGNCPVPIATLPAGMKSDAWANGLSAAPLVRPDQVRALAARRANLYTIKYYNNDPARTLGLQRDTEAFATGGPYSLASRLPQASSREPLR